MATVNQPEGFLKQASGPESSLGRQRSVRETALGKALSAAQEVSDPLARAEALAAIALHLPDAEREAPQEEAVRAAREALGPARAISDPIARAEALAAIALHLPDAEREAPQEEAVRAAREALGPARAISDPIARAEALAAIALHLPDAERGAPQEGAVRAAREALGPARAISDPIARAEALAAIASHLPDAEREAPLEEAVRAARWRPLFGRESDRIRIGRAAALIRLARHLPDIEREAAQHAALDAVRRISNDSDRATFSLSLAARLRDTKREEALRLALDAARMVCDRTSVSARLIPRSPGEAAFWAALAIARAILDARERADVLVSLALLSPEDDHGMRAVFSVAWPVWAGGYPGPDSVFRDLNSNKDLLISMMLERVNRSISIPDPANIKVSIEHFETGSYSPIRGLTVTDGKPGPANSVRLRVHVQESNPQAELSEANALAILGCLRDAIRHFFTRNQGGAELYEISTRWGWGRQEQTFELKDENQEVDRPDENERRQGMSEFAQLLDDQLRMFEASGEWRLSLPAKVTIQQGFISLTVDTLGMGEITQRAQRDAAAGKALETLPGFLRHLVNVAKPLAEDAERRNLPNTRMIGGILVLQHLKTWASMFGCSCWPE